MTRNLVALCLAVGVAGVAVAEDMDSRKARSRAAIQAYGASLKSELQAAMKAGGPMNAVGVCNLSAPAIAGAVSNEHQLSIGRTSLKNRNPGNAPTDWQRDVLESFEQRKADGEDPMALEYAELAETDEGQEFRYMKAIPTADLCLNCHGSDLPADLSAKIQSLYPGDKATGYTVGELRGAFVVTEKVTP